MTQAPIYLDHNASTPMDAGVIDQVVWAMRELPGNPSAVDHVDGAAAANAVETAREKVASGIGARPADIVFVSGATEANNLAIQGALRAQSKKGRTRLITVATEHPSVLTPVAAAHECIVLSVDEEGRVDLGQLEEKITSETALVTCMAANNETGVRHPITEIGKLCEQHGVLFHTDLTQLIAYGEIDVLQSGIHLASLSGHKMYGPKGVGALYCRRRRPHVNLEPILLGGGHEQGLRSGTLNTPGIVGLGAAFDLRRERLQSAGEIGGLRDALEKRLVEDAGALVNGGGAPRLPNALNVSIPSVEPLALMRRLSSAITFSSSSACSTKSVEDSHVLEAMYGVGTARTRGAFRLGLGFGTTRKEIERSGNLLVEAVSEIRKARLGSAA